MIVGLHLCKFTNRCNTTYYQRQHWTQENVTYVVQSSVIAAAFFLSCSMLGLTKFLTSKGDLPQSKDSTDYNYTYAQSHVGQAYKQIVLNAQILHVEKLHLVDEHSISKEEVAY